MKIAFRVDASLDIGTGHVMRCLTVADALSSAGDECVFLCRDLPEHLAERLESAGHSVRILERRGEGSDDGLAHPAHSHWLAAPLKVDAEETLELVREIGPDVLFVDHYAIDSRWETILRGSVGKLVVIDDIFDRRHVCDMLFDHNLGRTVEHYSSLVDSKTELLLGSEYALLRPEFRKSRPDSLARRGDWSLSTLLVSMGGVDKPDLTSKVIDALGRSELAGSTEVVVVLGASAPHYENVSATAGHSRLSINIEREVSDMARLMRDADLAIGGAGTTSWERCCLGLPSIVFVQASNQEDIATNLELAGAALVAREADDSFVETINRLHRDPKRLKRLSDSSAAIIDGHGVQRLVNALRSRMSGS